MARESKGITLPIVYKANLDGLKQAEGALSGFGKKLAGVAAGIAAAFSIRAITNFAKESVLVAEAAATAQARLEAVAKATNVFGENTKQVTDRLAEFAKTQEMRIAVDDKVIKGVQAQLLSFKLLSATADEAGGTFDRVTQAAFDMAAAGFGSAESNAIALGKAFEDPVAGLTALRRSGTVFTEEQQELIKSLVATGDVAGAQEIILGELESQYGGVAEATANASDKLTLAFENIKETAGAALLPVFAEIVTGMMPVLDMVGEELANAFTELGPVLTNLANQIPGLLSAFIPLIPTLGSLAGLFLDLIARILPVFVDLFAALLPIITDLVPVVASFITDALDLLVPIIVMLAEALVPIIKQILPVLFELFRALAPVVTAIVEAMLPLIQLVLPILTDLILLLLPIVVSLAAVLGKTMVLAINLLVGAIRFVGDVLKTFFDFFKTIWDGIALFFQNIINGLVGGFEGFVNAIIGGVNFIIRALNRIQVKAPAWMERLTGISSFGINIQELSKISLPRVALAEGGIVTRPVSALVGEAGPEAVIPLDKLGNMGGNVYNITINSTVADARLGEVVVSAIKRYERVSGPVFASA
jgi:phage-related protein